jgi:hypothetical protein
VKYEDTYCSISDDRICDIRQNPPDITHTSTKLFCFSSSGDQIAFMSIQSPNESPDAGTFNRSELKLIDTNRYQTNPQYDRLGFRSLQEHEEVPKKSSNQ